MDNKLQNNTWDNILDLAAMEEHQIFHNPSPFDSLWPSNYNSFQLAHQIPSSSTPKPLLFGDQQRVLDNMEDQDQEEPEEELGAMKEMMYKIAAMQPVDIDPATIRKPKRRNVRISDDPQSVAARHRRERISEKIRILQRLVPGGTKMDTASMLDEAIRYVKFLKRQIRQLQSTPPSPPPSSVGVLTGDRNWPDAPPNKASSLAEPPPASFPFGAEPLCFNHEVISD